MTTPHTDITHPPVNPQDGQIWDGKMYRDGEWHEWRPDYMSPGTDVPTAGKAPEVWDVITLDMKDPYERVLIEMVTLSRRKSADYAADNDRFSNFRISGAFSGVTPLTSCRVLLGTKIARLQELLKPGKTPKNESIRDTMVDMAVYSAIAVALLDEENKQ